MTKAAAFLRAGIDIGGTGTRIALLRDEHEVASESIPTAWFATLPQDRRAEALVDKICSLLPAESSLSSLGIGASGPVNNSTEIIENNDTLACFSYYPLVQQLRERLGILVAIDNDAVAAAIGEYQLGAGHGSQRMMMVTLGTGIGVALLDRGQPLRGADGSHPEAGHIPVSSDPTRCYCGLQGCWEMLASREQLQKKLEKQITGLQWNAQTPALLKALMTTRPRVAQVINQYGENVGRGLNTLLALYRPDVTVLGGSAAPLLPLFQPGLDNALMRAGGYAVSRNIQQSVLGDAAGALGAAILPTLRETRQHNL